MSDDELRRRSVRIRLSGDELEGSFGICGHTYVTTLYYYAWDFNAAGTAFEKLTGKKTNACSPSVDHASGIANCQHNRAWSRSVYQVAQWTHFDE